MSDRMLKKCQCSVNICKLLFCNLFKKQYKTVKKKHFVEHIVEKNGKLGLHWWKRKYLNTCIVNDNLFKKCSHRIINSGDNSDKVFMKCYIDSFIE